MLEGAIPVCSGNVTQTLGKIAQGMYYYDLAFFSFRTRDEGPVWELSLVEG